jgi:hypothetical protein
MESMSDDDINDEAEEIVDNFHGWLELALEKAASNQWAICATWSRRLRSPLRICTASSGRSGALGGGSIG